MDEENNTQDLKSDCWIHHRYNKHAKLRTLNQNRHIVDHTDRRDRPTDPKQHTYSD